MSLVPSDGVMTQCACPLCGGHDLKLVAKRGQFGFKCHVSVCRTDGFVFLSPRWSQQRYAKFYAHEYDRYYRTDLGELSDSRRHKNIRLIVDWLTQQKLLVNPHSVLDVGAGMGWALDYVRRVFPTVDTVAAIEPSRTCLDQLLSTGVEVIATDVESDWEGPHERAFDFIIMRHVLEHFLDPVVALRKVAFTLSERGILFVAVPDMMHPSGSLSEYWFRVVHTSYFSLATLSRAAALAGLAPQRIEVVGSELRAAFVRSTALPSADPGIKEAFANQLSVIRKAQRHDLAPNLVRRCKGLLRRALSVLVPAVKR